MQRGHCNCCTDEWSLNCKKQGGFSTDYEKQNDWKLPRGRAPMIISDPTMYVESMQGSVVDLCCSLQQIPLLCSVKTALLQYLSYSFLFSSSANLSLTFFVCSCFDPLICLTWNFVEIRFCISLKYTSLISVHSIVFFLVCWVFCVFAVKETVLFLWLKVQNNVLIVLECYLTIRFCYCIFYYWTIWKKTHK